MMVLNTFEDYRVSIMLIPIPDLGNKSPGTRDYLEIGIFQREIKMEIACRKTGKIYMVNFGFPDIDASKAGGKSISEIGSNSRSP